MGRPPISPPRPFHTAMMNLFEQGVVARKILKGQPFSNNDVIRAMTSLLQLSLQNIGGAAATPATPATTPLGERGRGVIGQTHHVGALFEALN